MIGNGLKRARAMGLAALMSVGLTACVGDAETWEGIAMGLNMAADGIAAENEYRAQCYPKSLSGMPLGNASYPDLLCPGDYGYNSGFVNPPVYGYGHRPHHHGHKPDGRGDRKHRR